MTVIKLQPKCRPIGANKEFVFANAYANMAFADRQAKAKTAVAPDKYFLGSVHS